MNRMTFYYVQVCSAQIRPREIDQVKSLWGLSNTKAITEANRDTHSALLYIQLETETETGSYGAYSYLFCGVILYIVRGEHWHRTNGTGS